MRKTRRNKLTSVERDRELRARVRATIREITLPRGASAERDPREQLPLSIPVEFEQP
jgi:hypothetical protein